MNCRRYDFAQSAETVVAFLEWNYHFTWENNLKYIPSLDPKFADYLTDGMSLGKKMLHLYVVSLTILNLFQRREEGLLLKR